MVNSDIQIKIQTKISKLSLWWIPNGANEARADYLLLRVLQELQGYVKQSQQG